MSQAIDISVVIPTRNRPDLLHRLLQCLSYQRHLPREVIVVDSSERPANEDNLKKTFPLSNVRVIVSPPSVCLQRNTGISQASSPYIFLCDDDIEVGPDYLEKIVDHARLHPDAQVLSGTIKEKNKQGQWESQHVPGTLGLYRAFLFHQGLWADVSRIKYTVWNFIPLGFFRAQRKKGNCLSAAGWPRVIDFSGPVFLSPVYGLGASVIKKELLLAHPYEEVLDPYGIGDNFVLIMNFPGTVPVHVLNGAEALHHKSVQNRLQTTTAYFRRVLVLHYVMCTHPRFTFRNRLALGWSVFGNALVSLIKMNISLLRINTRLILHIAFGKNPYREGKRNHRKNVSPQY